MKRLTISLACAALLAGCGREPDPAPPASSAAAMPATDHHGNAPHGGTVADWGGGAYHVEFTVDHDKKEATVYVLGSDGQSPAPINAETIQLTINDPKTEMELVAKPLEGEAEGTSSRFIGTHDTIGMVKEFAGTISGMLDGDPYVGDFKELPHGADHKH
jgi:hypothetical protein